jgi:hypothetical protein
MSPAAEQLRSDFARWQRTALLAGGVASLVLVIGAFFGARQFFRSYLIAYVFWFSIAAGCLALAMLTHLIRGQWRIVAAPFFESGSRTLPLLAALFLPFVFGVPLIYEWAAPEAHQGHPLIAEKALYLNLPFFWFRAAVYFAAWLAFTFFLNRFSRRQTSEETDRWARPLRMLSAAGLVVFGLTITFASFDWIMSLEPEWFSSIFGAIIAIGAVLGAFVFVVAIAGLLAERGPLAVILTRNLSVDLGSLMLAFLMIWAYFQFSQYLLIYSANTHEEVPWYLRRLRGGWQYVPLALAIFHFAIPFLLLLSREFKSSPRLLARLALLLLAMRLLDVYWIVAPSFYRTGFFVHWLDPVAIVALGGLWLAFFFWQAAREPALRAFPFENPAAEGTHG